MAINIEEDLQAILIEAGLNIEQRSKVIKIAQEVENEKKAEKDASKGKSKSKFTVVVRGDAKLKDALAHAWIVQTPLDQDDDTLIQRMIIGAARNNENAKKKGKVFSWVEFFQFVKSKFLKDEDVNLKVKTKEAVRVIVLEEENIPFK